MSSTLRSVGLTLWELLVDDGQLAVGIVTSLGVAWILAHLGSEALADLAGWVLLVLLCALMIANLARAGRNARRKMSA